MHELAVCQALIAQVEVIAAERAARVSKVHISIGPLSGVEAQLIADAYPVASAGTSAAGSDLAIEQAAVRVRCRSCTAESGVAPNRLLCGNCGSWQTDIIAGDECFLLRVELLGGAVLGEAHV